MRTVKRRELQGQLPSGERGRLFKGRIYNIDNVRLNIAMKRCRIVALPDDSVSPRLCLTVNVLDATLKLWLHLRQGRNLRRSEMDGREDELRSGGRANALIHSARGHDGIDRLELRSRSNLPIKTCASGSNQPAQDLAAGFPLRILVFHFIVEWSCDIALVRGWRVF